MNDKDRPNARSVRRKVLLRIVLLSAALALVAAAPWFSSTPAAAQWETCFTFERGVSPAGSGNITVYPPPNCSNGVQYRYGTLLQITAVPYAGGSFTSWSGDAYGASNPTTVVMYGYRYVVANFSQACYSLARSVSPGGSGSIAASPTPNCANGTQYQPGTVVQLTAHAGPGYNFANWSGSTFGSVNPYQLIMDGPKTAVANFTQPCYELIRDVAPAGGGSIVLAPPPNCPDGRQYRPGTLVYMTAYPGPGYNFASWSGDAGGGVNPYPIMINGPKTVTANFAPYCYDLSWSAAPAGAGSVSVSPGPNCPNGKQYLPNSIVQLSANPNPGYFFNHWSGNAFGTVNPFNIIMDGNKSAVANFDAPIPAISMVSPEMVLVGGPAFILSITGNNLKSGSQIRWNSYTLATQWINDQALEARIPASSITATGIGWVRVVSKDGLLSEPQGVAIGNTQPAPALQRAEPSFLPARGQPGTLRLLGRNFANNAQVYWNNVPLPTSFIKSTELRASAPGAYLAQVSAAQVLIFNPAPGGGQSVAVPVKVLRAVYLPAVRKR